MCEILPVNKPRHLLGLSHPDDIFVGVETGSDTFDCVAPTREARHGRIYTMDGNFNLKKSEFQGMTSGRWTPSATALLVGLVIVGRS